MKKTNPNRPQVCRSAEPAACAAVTASGTYLAVRPTLEEARAVIEELRDGDPVRPEVQFAIGGS
jgi:hypothetical protein